MRRNLEISHISRELIFHKDVKLFLLVPESLSLIARLNYDRSSDSSGSSYSSACVPTLRLLTKFVAKRNEILRALDRAQFCNSI